MSKNPGFLKDNFFKTVGPYIFAGLTVLVPFTNATGQDIIPAKHNPSAGQESIEKLYSKKDAYLMSEGKAVLHYGEGFLGAENLARGLSEEGYTTIAIPGGPAEKVQIRVNKSMGDVIFTQSEFNDGTVGGIIIEQYQKRIGSPTHQPVAESLAGGPLAFAK